MSNPKQLNEVHEQVLRDIFSAPAEVIQTIQELVEAIVEAGDKRRAEGN